MNRHSIAFLALFFAPLGCKASFSSVYQPKNILAEAPHGSPYTKSQIAKAIYRGFLSKGWSLLEQTDEVIMGRLRWLEHDVTVKIPFDERSYEIIPVSISKGLRDDSKNASEELVHRRYNHWVNMLDKAIRTSLLSQRITSLPIIESEGAVVITEQPLVLNAPVPPTSSSTSATTENTNSALSTPETAPKP